MSIGALNAFLEALVVERGAAVNTVAAYRRDLEHAEASFGGGLEEAGEADLRRYLADLLQAGLSPRTVSRRRSALRQFFLFCTAEGYREDNPADRLDAPKTGRPLPRHLGVEEVGRLIEAIESQDGPAQLRLYCIVELLYGAGLRVSELVGLAMSDVPPGRAWLTVRGKGGGLRLGRPADAIAVGAVVRVMESGIPLAACFPGGVGGCRIEACCALKGVLAEAEAAFFAVLDRYSVDDLVRGNPELRTFLLDGPPDMRPSDAGRQGSATAPRPSTSGRGAGTRRDRRASPDSLSARGR